MTAFTAAQRSEMRDAMARSQAEAHEEHMRFAKAAQERKAAERAEARLLAPPKRRRRREVLPPKSAPKTEPATRQQQELADRLMAHVSPYSVVDRSQHALGVARLVLNGRRTR